MEGLSIVLEKNDSEDCCGDEEERSSDIVFHVIFDILGIYVCLYVLSLCRYKDKDICVNV